jgi:hypothetical protein
VVVTPAPGPTTDIVSQVSTSFLSLPESYHDNMGNNPFAHSNPGTGMDGVWHKREPPAQGIRVRRVLNLIRSLEGAHPCQAVRGWVIPPILNRPFIPLSEFCFDRY